MLIDSHCHLADEAFAADLDDVVARARTSGLRTVVTILAADDAAELERADRVKAAWDAVRFATAIHPQRAGMYSGRAMDVVPIVSAAADRFDAVMLGEMGLDYHYDHAPRDTQREVFAAQVDLAVARGLPVVIHTREAFDDTMAILRATDGQVRGVMHCFTGTMDEARQALDIGFYLSMSGIVTFPKAGSLRDVAAFVPADRLLIETDAPYLAPVPNRGKRNEPAWVAETLRAVAGTRNVPVETLGPQVVDNLEELLRPRRA